MAGVVSIVQNSGLVYSGASQEIAKTTSYFLELDSATASKNTNRITLPEAGTKYSYEVWIRCRCDLAPTTKFDNFKVWYDSGIPVSGYTITVNSDEVSTYAAPTNLQSSQGTRVDFTTKNSEGSSISLTGELVNISDYTSYLVFQLEIASTADTGDFSIDYIIQYDEM
jgi:hypothetical protein